MELDINKPSLLELRQMRDERQRMEREERRTIKGRNEQIARKYLVDGIGATELAKEFKISRARVYQIINDL